MIDAIASRQLSQADAESGADPRIPVFERDADQPPRVQSFREASWTALKEQLTGVDSSNCRFVLRVRGHLELQVLEAALHEIRLRHDVLHATVTEIAGHPWLVFEPQASWSVEKCDVAYLPRSEREAAARAAASELVWREMDPVQGPLFRAFVITLDAEDHVLGLVVHHFIADSVSMRLLSEDVIRNYSMMSAGHRAQPSQGSLQYRDYLLGIAHWIERPAVRAQLSQWTDRLAASMPMDLVHRSPQVPTADRACARYPFEIDAATAAAIASTARQLRTSKWALLLTVQKMLLAALTSHDRVTLGVVTSGRELPVLEPVIGYLADRLYWSTQLDGDPSFDTVVTQVNESHCEALRHQFFRSDLIQRELSRRGKWLHAPVFNFIPYSRPRANVANNRFSWFEVDPPPFSTIPLPGISYWMVITETSQAMRGDIRFPHGCAETLVRQFLGTLDLLIKDRTRRLSDVREALKTF